MRKILAFIFGNIMCFLIVTTMIDRKLMGKLVYMRLKGCSKKKFVVSRQNRIDFQTGYKCAAYSVAYLLRHYGIEANGNDIYTDMPNKMKNGCIYPIGIVHTLQSYGCQTAHCGRHKPHFDFGELAFPIVPYRHLPQTLRGLTAECRSLV